VVKLINFNENPIARGVFYGGNAGAKDAVIFDGGAWMIKFPKTTRHMTNPQISYTTSPLSEYIGSKIFESLDIPVHETVLGVRKNKIVVACKDFTRAKSGGANGGKFLSLPAKTLIPFHDLKNSFMSGDLESYSGTGSETLLDEVLATISGQDDLKSIHGVTERFWDMFVVDAFIGNNDRNNGNWGVLWDNASGAAELAPVFDNGNAFFNKRSLAQMEKRVGDTDAMKNDAFTAVKCAYKYTGLDNEGMLINPFTFISQGENADCGAAVGRFLRSLNFGAVTDIINNIPETVGNLTVMPHIQKAFYIELLRMRLEGLSDVGKGKDIG